MDKEWEKLEKISAWNLTKVRSKSEVIDEARTNGATVHFASLMDICHLKNAELQTKHQKYKGRIVLGGDVVKDDSGSYVVFTEQGSSASQMTAAKAMDIISRLLGCARQAADAEFAYAEVKMVDAPKLLKIPKSECPDMDVYHDTSGPNHGRVWKTQSFFLNDICTEKFLIGNACQYIVKKRIILVCVCGRHQVGWKEKRHWSDVEST